MRVLIFTEGGGEIGFGHLSRCSSLYDEIENRGIPVEFIINSEEKEFDLLKNKNYIVKNWLSTEFLGAYITSEDFCIVDSYCADLDLYTLISNCSKQALFIDDNLRLDYPKGIIVNPSLDGDSLPYPKGENIYLLGADFIILRKPFIVQNLKRIRPQISDILITLGGADVWNLTPKLTEKLSGKFNRISFHVVIGKGSNKLKDIKTCKTDTITIYQNISAEKMAALMQKCDIAITAAGQTIYELMATGTPFITIQSANNQVYNAAALLKYNICRKVFCPENTYFMEDILHEIDFLGEKVIRQDLQENHLKYIDGKGVQRIVTTLIRGNIK